MRTVLNSLIPFLAILNPFALCLYLAGVMDDLEFRDFARVLTLASVISLVVFCVFAFAGEPLLVGLLGVRPEALRIFGGIIFFVVAYNYVTKGYKGAEVLRGNLDELPSAIALPFIIGAGTITQATLLGKKLSYYYAALVLCLGITICFIVVMGFKCVRDRMRGAKERVFERYVNILSRINGLLIGAISTEMIVSGFRQLWVKD